MPTISGTIYDSNGAAAVGRVVRAYQRDTGALLGNTLTSVGPQAPFRFIRFRQIATSGYLETSELQLFEGNTQRIGTISATTAPSYGSVTSLIDGNLGTRAQWASSVVADSTFAIVCDFGSGNTYAIDGFKQGGFDASGRHIQAATVEYSQNGTQWYLLKLLSDLPYPGNYTLSAMIPLSSGNLQPGQYQIDCGSYTGEVQRVVLDDDAGDLYNDLIDRVLLS